MDFEDNLYKLVDKIKNTQNKVNTEEATKTSFILPMLHSLGYDIFDPSVVVPEFTADIGKKKNEKVDYAIMLNDKPVILIEAKHHLEKLDRHKTQLERYFTVTDSKFGILTNGIEWWFYSDLEKPNVMDDKPFFKLTLLDIKKRDIKELEKFKSENFDIENILNMAEVKKYVSAIKSIFKEEVKEPHDDFVKLFASKLTDKHLRTNILDEFRIYVKQAFNEIINDIVTEKINSLSDTINNHNDIDEEGIQIKDDGIVTTEEELEGFFIVKSVLAEKLPLNRIIARDTKSYFGILLDDNNRKWLVRLHFNTSNKYLEIRTGEKESEKYLLEKLEDIYSYKEIILNTFQLFEDK